MRRVASLRTRLLLGVTLVTALMLVFIVVVLPGRLDALGLQAAEESAMGVARLLEGEVEPGLSRGDMERVAEALAPLGRSRDTLYGVVLDAGGRAAGRFEAPRAGRQGALPDLPAALGLNPLLWVESADRSLHVASQIRDARGLAVGTLRLGFSLERLEAQREDNLFVGAVVGLCLSVVAWITMALVSTTITGPLGRLNESARLVAEGRMHEVRLLDDDMPEGSPDEVVQLSRTFALMLERLRQAHSGLELRVRAEEELRRDAERQRSAAEGHREQLREALERVEQAQEQLIQADKMATLGQLVAGIAHEVNTPLGAITASCGVVSDSLLAAWTDWQRLFPNPQSELAKIAWARVQAAAAGPVHASTRQGRRDRRRLAEALAEGQGGAAAALADQLMDLGVGPDSPELGLWLAHPDPAAAVASAHALATVVQNVENVRVAAAKARTVVLALKTFARSGVGGDPIDVDLFDSVSTVLTLYANQLRQGANLTVELEGRPQVLGNPDELGQVWTNLIQNALQAMGGRGDLEVAVKTVGDQAQVWVTNAGPPIPPALLDRIFEPFFTTKPAGEGSGLGLEIVRKVVQGHKGAVSVTCADGRTRFVVSLPLRVIGGA